MDWNFTDDENFPDFDDEYSLFEEFGSTPDNISRARFAIVGFLIICGIFENAMICWILVRKKKYLRNFANFHLLNLAITDNAFQTKMWCSNLIKFRVNTENHFKNGYFFGVK